MIYTIEQIKEKAVPIAIANGVDSLGLFGSYARGEADEESDLDFFGEMGQVDSLFKHSAMRLELEDAFGCSVDLVSLRINNEEFIRELKKDGIILYAR